MKYSDYQSIGESKRELGLKEDLCLESKVSALQEGFVVKEDYQLLSEAHFSFIPKFRASDELQKYEDLAKQAESLLNDEGVSAATGMERCNKLMWKITKICNDICSVFSLVSCITIVGIIPHLYMRFITWCCDEYEEAEAMRQGKKLADELERVAKKCDDKAKARLFEQKADQIRKSMAKVEKASKVGK